MAEPALAYSPPPCPALNAILALDEDTLPCTDDQPMPDARAQEGPLGYSRDVIRFHLQHMRDRVAVDADMFVHYISREKDGQPVRAVVAPDVFVVFGVPDRLDRKSYVLWREPNAEIRFVLEIASASTRRRDHTVKRDVYASLGVREYFLFDPPERNRPARLMGLKLRDGNYREISAEVLPGNRPGIRSEVVGLVAHVDEDGNLRWFNPAEGVDLNNYVEAEGGRRQEAEGRRQERAARQRAEERQRQESAARQRAEERQRQEAAARRRAEARVAELEAELRRSRR